MATESTSKPSTLRGEVANFFKRAGSFAVRWIAVAVLLFLALGAWQGLEPLRETVLKNVNNVLLGAKIPGHPVLEKLASFDGALVVVLMIYVIVVWLKLLDRLADQLFDGKPVPNADTSADLKRWGLCLGKATIGFVATFLFAVLIDWLKSHGL